MDASAVGRIRFFDGLEGLAKIIVVLGILCLVFIPLGVWKLVEIIVWLTK